MMKSSASTKSMLAPVPQNKINANEYRTSLLNPYSTPSLKKVAEIGIKQKKIDDLHASPLVTLRPAKVLTSSYDRKNEERIFMEKLSMLPSMSAQPKMSQSVSHSDFVNSMPIFRRGRYDLFGANGPSLYTINTLHTIT
jgi:hypothetical protein